MIRINLGEMNEVSLSLQALRYKETMAIDVERRSKEKPVLNSNDAAKCEVAAELMMQGFSEEAICRILNISADKLPDTLPF